MSRPEIIQKLDFLLQRAIPFHEEREVVYLLVEIRKILDRDNNRKYPLLRFYADWSVHTEKDRITKEIRGIMKRVYRDIHRELTIAPLNRKTEIMSFMYMEALRTETDKFLDEYGLPLLLSSNNDYWILFIGLLVNVLADQPINKPTKEIKSFSFLPARQGCVRGRIVFNTPIRKYHYYEFGNTY